MLGNAPPTHTNPALVIDALSKDTLQLLECESSNLDRNRRKCQRFSFENIENPEYYTNTETTTIVPVAHKNKNMSFNIENEKKDSSILPWNQ